MPSHAGLRLLQTVHILLCKKLLMLIIMLTIAQVEAVSNTKNLALGLLTVLTSTSDVLHSRLKTTSQSNAANQEKPLFEAAHAFELQMRSLKENATEPLQENVEKPSSRVLAQEMNQPLFLMPTDADLEKLGKTFKEMSDSTTTIGASFEASKSMWQGKRHQFHCSVRSNGVADTIGTYSLMVSVLHDFVKQQNVIKFYDPTKVQQNLDLFDRFLTWYRDHVCNVASNDPKKDEFKALLDDLTSSDPKPSSSSNIQWAFDLFNIEAATNAGAVVEIGTKVSTVAGAYQMVQFASAAVLAMIAYFFGKNDEQDRKDVEKTRKITTSLNVLFKLTHRTRVKYAEAQRKIDESIEEVKAATKQLRNTGLFAEMAFQGCMKHLRTCIDLTVGVDIQVDSCRRASTSLQGQTDGHVHKGGMLRWKEFMAEIEKIPDISFELKSEFVNILQEQFIRFYDGIASYVPLDQTDNRDLMIEVVGLMGTVFGNPDRMRTLEADVQETLDKACPRPILSLKGPP